MSAEDEPNRPEARETTPTLSSPDPTRVFDARPTESHGPSRDAMLALYL
jgi:hypothetical protein